MVWGWDVEKKNQGKRQFCLRFVCRKEKKKKEQQTRCVKALPLTLLVVKTFYEQTMSVYWNHMITEMGSFIVFRPNPSAPSGRPRPLARSPLP